MRKKALFFVLVVGITLQMIMPIFGNVSGVYDAKFVIGGNKANIITIDMSSENRTLDVALGNGNLHSDAPANQLVLEPESDDNLTVVAGINGGFFNSYYNGTPSYPNNYPIVYGTVVKDGTLITGGGELNLIGITRYGEILVDRADIRIDVIFNNSFKVSPWSVGAYTSDDQGVSFLTSEFPYAVTTEPNSKVFTITNNEIVAVNGSGTYTVPENSSLLIYNEGAVANFDQWGNLPQLGQSAFVNTYAVSSTKGEIEKWEYVKMAITGGRMLIQNGVDVTNDNSYNEYYNNDSKQNTTSALQRSFVAKMPNGDLVMGTVNASFNNITSYLLSIGAVDAISLDGGASSMLYTANIGFATSAGRKLASALVVVDESVKVENTNYIPIFIDSNTPSPWAVDYVEKGISNGLIPDHYQTNYRKDITREEFCVLIVKLIEQKSGDYIDKFRQDRGFAYADAFFDTDGYFVRQCASLGIVMGSDNTFRPNDTITREEAAVILNRTFDILELSGNINPVTFNDNDKISTWANEGVKFITGIGIMNGVGDDFNPKGLITREQVYITMQRILEY